MACNKSFGLNCDGRLAGGGCAVVPPRRIQIEQIVSGNKNPKFLHANITSASATRLAALGRAPLIVKGHKMSAASPHAPACLVMLLLNSTQTADLTPAAGVSHVCMRASRSRNLVSLRPR